MYFQANVEAWNVLRARLRPKLVMTPDLLGQLFNAPIPRCSCRRPSSVECNVNACNGCYDSMAKLIEYAAQHLFDGSGAGVDANSLEARIRSRPDEWDVLRIGLLPVEVAVVEAEVCPICLANDPGVRRRHLSCGHGVHAACVTRWLRRSRTCPVCRTAQ
jgi:hypothetical protein